MTGARPSLPPARGRGGRRRRFGKLQLLLLAATLVLTAAGGMVQPLEAAAHFKSFSTVELEVEGDRITGEVQLPYDMLVLLPLKGQTEEQLIAWIRRYAGDHISAEGAGGKAWTVRVSGGREVHRNGVNDLVFDLSLTPPRGRLTDFSLTYNAIIQQIPSHKAVLLMRSDGGDSQVLGFFASDQPTLQVHASGGGSSVTDFGEFKSGIGLGIDHISEGSDHLLFLMTLLLPAPLMIRRRRWVRCDDPKRSVIRIVHVVTAFAIGHSITLALAGLGLIHVPERPIEALIALSILVSSIHAIRPLIPEGEAVIAAGFGLVHGLAFAALLGDLDLERGALVFTLLGFNLGIELTQLLVVALIMPSLYLLSRTTVYTPFRVGGGTVGIVLAGGWLLQRTTLTPTDPFEPLTNALVFHPFYFVASLAVFSVGAYFLSSARAPLWGQVQGASE